MGLLFAIIGGGFALFVLILLILDSISWIAEKRKMKLARLSRRKYISDCRIKYKNLKVGDYILNLKENEREKIQIIRYDDILGEMNIYTGENNNLYHTYDIKDLNKTFNFINLKKKIG